VSALPPALRPEELSADVEPYAAQPTTKRSRLTELSEREERRYEGLVHEVRRPFASGTAQHPAEKAPVTLVQRAECVPVTRLCPSYEFVITGRAISHRHYVVAADGP
jgi:hypothetical protein